MSLLINKHYSSVDKYESVKHITFKMMREYCKKVIKNIYIDVLVQGNVYAETVISTVENLIQTLDCQSLSEADKRKVRKIIIVISIV